MGLKDNCCSNPDHRSGCMVCGSALYYTSDMPLMARCYFCGKEEATHVFCQDGHYVCDACHRKDILELVEHICIESTLTDPVALALCIFDLKKLHMHGPEYHSIVPAVLVAAYGNGVHEKDVPAIKEAIERGKAIPGGMCGTHGACGACIGVGIAYSIIRKVTPYSKVERGKANRMTAQALIAISPYGGPRCCKRDSILALETAKREFGCFGTMEGCQYVCTQWDGHDRCIHEACPFFPKN